MAGLEPLIVQREAQAALRSLTPASALMDTSRGSSPACLHQAILYSDEPKPESLVLKLD